MAATVAMVASLLALITVTATPAAADDFDADLVVAEGPPGSLTAFTLDPDCAEEGDELSVASEDEGIEVTLATGENEGTGGVAAVALDAGAGDLTFELLCDRGEEVTDTFTGTFTVAGSLGEVEASRSEARPGHRIEYTDDAPCAAEAEGTMQGSFAWVAEAGDPTAPEESLGAIGSPQTAPVDEDGEWDAIELNVPTEAPEGAGAIMGTFICTTHGGAYQQLYGFHYVELLPPCEAEECPGAPTDVVGVPGDGEVTVSWEAPEDEGASPIEGYWVLGFPGGSCVAEAPETSCTVEGLTNGAPYFFTVIAVNDDGSGEGSVSDPSKLYRPRPDTLPVNPFNDIPREAYYAVPVDWAALFGITTGIGDTNSFGSFFPLLRSQIVTFLWRFSDQPQGYPPHGFVDVPAGTFYENPLRWAKAEGVTTGIGGTNVYDPDGIVTRAQMITFAYRSAGSPTGFPAHGFTDVSPGTFYENALRWAKARGVTTGVGGSNRFEPNRAVARAEAITFLYRLANNEAAWSDPDSTPSTVLFDR